jgi:hypothetical protein
MKNTKLSDMIIGTIMLVVLIAVSVLYIKGMIENSGRNQDIDKDMHM